MIARIEYINDQAQRLVLLLLSCFVFIIWYWRSIATNHTQTITQHNHNIKHLDAHQRAIYFLPLVYERRMAAMPARSGEKVRSSAAIVCLLAMWTNYRWYFPLHLISNQSSVVGRRGTTMHKTPCNGIDTTLLKLDHKCTVHAFGYRGGCGGTIKIGFSKNLSIVLWAGRVYAAIQWIMALAWTVATSN